MKLPLLLSLVILTSCSEKKTELPPEAEKQLSFSDTQVWEKELTEYFDQTPVLLPENWEEKLHVEDPPKNSSEVTLKELSYLEGLESQQKDKLSEITSELDLPGAKFGNHPLSELDPAKFSQTIRLLQAVNFDATLVVVKFKNKYDRVRPSFLSKKLKTAIDNPNHPAYPSGHSTQAHVIALVLGDLNPSMKDVYWKDADRIAHNREIAGVHYPSDTQAGISLAKQIHSLLNSDVQYLRLLAMAKDEWKGKQ